MGGISKLWHERNIRFIIIGIASSAAELFGADTELGIRNDPFELKTQDEQFVRSLIARGEEALNILFSAALEDEIVAGCNGVPSIVHVICRILCVQAGVNETVKEQQTVDFRLRDQASAVLRIIKAKYFDKVVGLEKGSSNLDRFTTHILISSQPSLLTDNRSEIPVEYLFRRIVGPIADPKQIGNRKSTSFYNCLNNLDEVITSKRLNDVLFLPGGR